MLNYSRPDRFGFLWETKKEEKTKMRRIAILSVLSELRFAILKSWVSLVAFQAGISVGRLPIVLPQLQVRLL